MRRRVAKGREGLRRKEKGERVREERAEKERETVKGRETVGRLAKRERDDDDVDDDDVDDEGAREGGRRLMRHAHVGTCLRLHPRSPRTSINNPSTPAQSENCR